MKTSEGCCEESRDDDPRDDGEDVAMWHTTILKRYIGHGQSLNLCGTPALMYKTYRSYHIDEHYKDKILMLVSKYISRTPPSGKPSITFLQQLIGIRKLKGPVWLGKS